MPVCMLFENDAAFMGIARLVLRQFEMDIPEGATMGQAVAAVGAFCGAMTAPVLIADLHSVEARIARVLVAQTDATLPAPGAAARPLGRVEAWSPLAG